MHFLERFLEPPPARFTTGRPITPIRPTSMYYIKNKSIINYQGKSKTSNYGVVCMRVCLVIVVLSIQLSGVGNIKSGSSGVSMHDTSDKKRKREAFPFPSFAAYTLICLSIFLSRFTQGVISIHL